VKKIEKRIWKYEVVLNQEQREFLTKLTSDLNPKNKTKTGESKFSEEQIIRILRCNILQLKSKVRRDERIRCQAAQAA